MSIFQSESVRPGFARVLSQDCTLCGVRSQESLCAACFGDLPSRSATGCPQCDAEGTPAQLCGACLSAPPHFDETICAFRYAYPLDRLVQAYKFNANLNLLPLFADALARAVKSRLHSYHRTSSSRCRLAPDDCGSVASISLHCSPTEWRKRSVFHSTRAACCGFAKHRRSRD